MLFLWPVAQAVGRRLCRRRLLSTRRRAYTRTGLPHLLRCGCERRVRPRRRERGEGTHVCRHSPSRGGWALLVDGYRLFLYTSIVCVIMNEVAPTPKYYL